MMIDPGRRGRDPACDPVALRRAPAARFACTFRASVTLVVAVALASCDRAPTGPGLAAATSAAESRWAASQVHSYAFVAARACECTLEAAGPVRVVVTNDHVAGVTLMASGAPVDGTLWFDVPALFALVRSELAKRPALLEVEFDPARGYPIRVKYGDIAIDAGAVISISALVPN